MADIRAVEEYYRTLPDFQVEHIAWFEAHELEPEVLPILRAEVARRHLDPALHQAIDIHALGVPTDEFEALLRWFRGRPCPRCGSRVNPLNACRIERQRHMILFSLKEVEEEIACPDCLSARLRAATESARDLGCLLGGLGGWIRAIGSTRRNSRALVEVARAEPSPVLLAHVRFNIAPLVVKWRAETGERRTR